MLPPNSHLLIFSFPHSICLSSSSCHCPTRFPSDLSLYLSSSPPKSYAFDRLTMQYQLNDELLIYSPIVDSLCILALVDKEFGLQGLFHAFFFLFLFPYPRQHVCEVITSYYCHQTLICLRILFIFFFVIIFHLQVFLSVLIF